MKSARKIFPYLILTLSLILTVYVWRLSDNSIYEQASQRFVFRSANITRSIIKRMDNYRTILAGGVGLFAVSDHVSREQWRIYIESLRLPETFPGIQAVGFSKLISPAELNSHILGMRAEGFEDYTVRPEGIRELYTSTIYLEPFDSKNRRAFG